MRVKNLDELYSWKQIRKLQSIYSFNRHNSFVPVAICSSSGDSESYYCKEPDCYEWFGHRTSYYARMLWEAARKRLFEVESEMLAFDIVEASECFNTIRFRSPDKVREYCAEFIRIMRSLAGGSEVRCAIGELPKRMHPWDCTRQLREIVIPDEKSFCDYAFDEDIPECQETAPLDWNDVEGLFVELSETELAFLNGAKYVNKSPAQLDLELRAACRNLDVLKVKSLLEAGAKPNPTFEEPYYDTLLTDLFRYLDELQLLGSKINDVRNIIDMLVLHGHDLDFCPYQSETALFSAVRYSVKLTEYLIEKGANLNTVNWINRSSDLFTVLDNVGMYISAFGETAERKKLINLIKNSGGRSFDDIVPDFYAGD